MSRKIRFRVWNNNTNKYEYTELDYYFVIDQRIKAYVYEQYTGLKDKNGREIYEGDIVDIELHFRTGNEYIKGIVGFDYGCFIVKTIMDGHIHPLHIFTSSTRASVIGNIHENKELWGESV